MFGQLADPNGTNNALSQVLYGLALRLVPTHRHERLHDPQNMVEPNIALDMDGAALPIQNEQ